ncbi:LuxR family transcriptional regulator [Mycolicibacterium fortuitum]|uniref:ATP-binding protein n=1 Tax=Mycolicibacterium fortuitum TaxID=1766 RepID=UPI001CDBAEDD|nr:LuxR C-terminal-related transcriptional regulator [Mycolicibacterium fortuitum]UBV20184.1 LuxR family transcriptional regulator [Mycolicibacterium fortuitum]
MDNTPPSGPRHLLPADLTSLVGRRAEAAEVRRLLGSSRLVTLIGIGGVGKTRLATQVARKSQRAFADGVALAELAGVTDPGLVPLAVAESLGLAVRHQDVVWALTEYLRARDLLLILDNCEHLLDQCAVLARNLLSACPTLRILVTSREALRVSGEHVFLVPPLAVHRSDGDRDTAPTEAVQLFGERAVAVDPDFRITAENSSDIVELCSRLDGLPLAIELAAVRMRALTPAALLDRLDHRHDLLNVGDRSAAPRHHSLRAALEWSYELCSEPERRLWERLSVFSGWIMLSAAECICSDDVLPREDIAGHLSALVDKSIVARHIAEGHQGYRLLETVAEYGGEQLRCRGEEAAVRGRYRAYYCRLAHEFESHWFGPDQLDLVGRMRNEQVNVRAVLGAVLDDPDGGRAALQMAADLFWYWLGCGQLREGRHWLDRALAADASPSSERAAALWANGYIAIAEGKTVVALQMLRESQSLAESLGDTVNLAHATHFRGVAEHNLGNTTLGTELIREGSVLEEAGGPSLHHVLAQEQVGWLHCRRRDPQQAVEVLGRCLAECDLRDERWLRSWILTFLGLANWMLGELDLAQRQLREALAGKTLFHDSLGTAVVIELSAWLAARQDQPRRAARLLGAAQRAWEPIGNYPGGFELPNWNDEISEELRAALGDNEFEALLAEGRALSVDKAVGEAMGDPEPAPAAPALPDRPLASLSRREAEVAGMVAEGMTNKQIAQALVLSLRTVESHVEHIFAKLGVRSRTQVAVLYAAGQPPR